MSLIDEKGRLFGKINIIDFLVILFLLSLTPMFYFGYKIMAKKPVVVEVEEVEVEEVEEVEEEEVVVEEVLKVKFANLMSEIAKVVKIGDKQVEITEDNDEKLISKIVKVISDKHSEFVNQQGKIIKNPKYRDLILKVEALCVRKPEGLFLKDSPVKIGKSFEFTTDLYSISGTIIGMRGK